IPFSNFIFATLLIIFSLGLIEKDGLFLIIGYLGVVIYANFVYLFVLTAVKHLFG
ncbi:TPA: exopolysaccharide biosynthesis protein, partial [Legionella pneumophila]|nr:exopolysaccharide biosynthesis protein [Legionella pneumophila]